MASFKYDNGIIGIGHCHHTSTGYECTASHPGNMHGVTDRVMFFARHVVGSDGHPYTEIGMNGLEDDERTDALEKIKSALDDHGFSNVMCLAESQKEELCYAEHVMSDPNSVAVRLKAGSDGIRKAICAVGALVDERSRQFVEEQESIPDVLYHSIMHTMGADLRKGPGGEEHAHQKALQLAETMRYGFTIEAPVGSNNQYYT